MSTDCLFCRTVRGHLPATIVAEDEHCVAFRDIGPQAPTHVLVVPRLHVATLNDLEAAHETLAGRMLRRAAVIAKGRGYGKGYVAVVLATRWNAEQMLVFQVQIPKAMELYKATNGYAPRSHKEFMKDIIEANLVKLPELPPGEEYVYDKDTEKLMVYEVLGEQEK